MGFLDAVGITTLATKLKDYFVTKTDLNSALSDKQDKLVSGQTIKTINGNSLLNSGNLIIKGCTFGNADYTSASAQTKTIASGDAGYYSNGSVYIVRCGIANTYQSGTLRFNLSGSARDVYANGKITSSTNPLLWDAGDILMFVYIENSFHFVQKI